MTQTGLRLTCLCEWYEQQIVQIYCLYGNFGVINIDSLASNWTNEILEKDKFNNIAGESCDVVPASVSQVIGVAYPANLTGKVRPHPTDYRLTLCVKMCSCVVFN